AATWGRAVAPGPAEAAVSVMRLGDLVLQPLGGLRDQLIALRLRQLAVLDRLVGGLRDRVDHRLLEAGGGLALGLRDVGQRLAGLQRVAQLLIRHAEVRLRRLQGVAEEPEAAAVAVVPEARPAAEARAAVAVPAAAEARRQRHVAGLDPRLQL